METKYKVGDTVIINDKDWTVDEIRMKYGRSWVYELTHENTDGLKDSFTIETCSLETMVR
tara:strand:+ start:407 stop:586 length:180 start_codon:yes stop_codon:yes gene_type:complete